MDPGLVGYRYIAGISAQEYETVQDLRGRSANVSAGIVWPELPRIGEADGTVTAQPPAAKAEAEADVGPARAVGSDEEVREVIRQWQKDEVGKVEHEWPWARLFRQFDGVITMFGLPQVFNGVLYNRHAQKEQPKGDPEEKTVIIRSVTMRYKAPSRPTGTYAVLTPSAASPSPSPALSTESLPPTPVLPTPSAIPAYIKSTEPSALPPNYLDLRWRGIGFVLDLGFKRTEEGMAWEVAQMLEASTKRTDERRVGVEEREGVLRAKKEKEDREEEERKKGIREEMRRREEEERKERGRHWIGGMPVVGSW
jgi:hypothetical protein